MHKVDVRIWQPLYSLRRTIGKRVLTFFRKQWHTNEQRCSIWTITRKTNFAPSLKEQVALSLNNPTRKTIQHFFYSCFVFYDMLRTGKLLPIQTSDNNINPKNIEINIDIILIYSNILLYKHTFTDNVSWNCNKN